MSATKQSPAGNSQNKSRGNSGQPVQLTLNPERAPALISKWQKLLGSDLSEIRVVYVPDGVSVELYGKEGTPYFAKDSDGDIVAISVADYRHVKAKLNAPSSEDAKFAFRNKFEVRLNQEFPKSVDLGDGSESAIRDALQKLPFDQRRVMLMSNKQFKSAYPNGVVAQATT